MSITLIIIVFTALVSITAFGQRRTIDQLIFDPVAVTNQNQWYRFFTCGFIHADWEHLLFNMLSLYLFGQIVESAFQSDYLFAEKGKLLYASLYIVALPLSLLPTYFQHKDNRLYRSLGASGAVSAIVFAGILFNPTAKMGFFLIPPIIPGYIFGPLYLIISAWLGKRGADQINHSAHISGAIAGVALTCLLAWSMQTPYQPWQQFMIKVSSEF
ncbi:MAG: rhomboid family intramembrane serine protease [Chitinophagia bacterium]|nr:rhomboid family intramembrane serine protease [Chitinophagia bacterium]